MARMRGTVLPTVLPTPGAGEICSFLTAPLPCSLTIRLHETLRQCQDLKTEKSQMDRKINQLSEENGDLSFKVSVEVSGPHLEAPLLELVWKIPPKSVEENVLIP